MQPEQPAFHVPEYLQSRGVKVVPVPVYYPDVTEILGERVYRTLAAVPQPPQIDVVCVFRRPSDVAAHVPDILAVRALCGVPACAHAASRAEGSHASTQARPAAVWLQSGIRDDASAEVLARAGIRVVQDRCMYVEHANATR